MCDIVITVEASSVSQISAVINISDTRNRDRNLYCASHKMYMEEKHPIMRQFVFTILISLTQISAAVSKMGELANKHLIIAAEPWPPYTVITEDGDGKIRLEGIWWDHVKFWIYARNFTYTVVRSSDGSWGHCTQINNCTGMLGMVNRKEIDFALGIYYQF